MQNLLCLHWCVEIYKLALRKSCGADDLRISSRVISVRVSRPVWSPYQSYKPSLTQECWEVSALCSGNRQPSDGEDVAGDGSGARQRDENGDQNPTPIAERGRHGHDSYSIGAAYGGPWEHDIVSHVYKLIRDQHNNHSGFDCFWQSTSRISDFARHNVCLPLTLVEQARGRHGGCNVDR